VTKQSVAIVGAMGFAARDLIACLLRHPQVELVMLGDKLDQPLSLVSVYPEFRGQTDLVIENADASRINSAARIVFLALPHKVAQGYAHPFCEAGKIVIDLSADFRFDDISLYEKTYAILHEAKDLNKKAVYGLPELFRKEIRNATLIGNPGCYPTSIILGCAPLMETGWIDPASIIADSKSGVSGAGRAATPATHYVSCNESIRAYAIGSHRHTPEVEEKLSRLSKEKVTVQFTPHLTPMDRGILSTIYMNLRKDVNQEKIQKRFEEFYSGEPFVRILPQGQLPSTKTVSCTNFCDIGLVLDSRTGRLIVVSAIDNLLKGASGQAVQCMNIILGCEERAGLL